MSTTDWKDEIDRVFKEHGDAIPQSTKYMTELSQKHNVSVSTIRSHYYRLVKGLNQKPKQALVVPEPAWKKEINSEIESGKLPDVAKTYIQQVAAAFQVKESTVNAYYYDKLKKVKLAWEAAAPAHAPEQPKEREEREAAKQVKAEVPEEPKKLKMHPDYEYKKGTIIQVIVKRVESYGAFVETVDDYKITGLIHISQVRDKFISDLNKWFKIGQTVNAQVIEYSEADLRLNLSTKNLPMTEYSWRTGEPKTEAKQPEQQPSPVKLEFQEKLLAIKDKIVPESPTAQVPTISDRRMDTHMDTEWKSAKAFIESMIGNVSEDAERALRAIMQEQGVFSFTVALMGKKGNFTPDVGLLLAQELQKDVCATSVGENPDKGGL